MNFFSWGRGGDDAPAPEAAGSAPGADAGADADAEQRPRPAPLDLGDRPVDDAARWAASRARWNLAIKPDDQAFVEQKGVFERALEPGSGKSIDETLREHFSNYEVHKFSGWADRTREPDLYTQQRRDAENYNTLLTRPPWDHEAPQAFLAFKMTMLYFGFSVEPMKMNDFFRLPPGSGLFGLDDDGDGDGDLDDQRTFVPEEMRPLRFLNRYDKRCYGADNGHMMPDPTFEMYYGLPFQPPEGQQHGNGGPAMGAQVDMQIRGRGLGEDKDEDREDDSMSDVSIDGASFCSDSLLPDAPDVDLGGDGNDENGRFLNLRGGSGGSGSEGNSYVLSFSGFAPCDINYAGGFYTAVDSALVLGSRVNVQITVALVSVMPGKWGEVLQLERGTLGHEESETQLHGRLLAAYQRARHASTEANLVFFVCHSSKDQALVELQEKGQAVSTVGVPHHMPEVFHFSTKGPGGMSAAAYLWMPREVTENTGSNLYAQWFKTVLRVVSGPRVVAGKLGRPSAQLPRGSYRVQVGNISPSFHHQSPLPRKVWEAIVKQGRQGGSQAQFGLSFTSVDGQAFAQVPGYYPPASSTAGALDTAAVFRLAWDSVPAGDRASVTSILIKRPGNHAVAVFECNKGSVNLTSVDGAAAEARLRDWLQHKHFFNIVPQWDEYEATVPGPNGGYSTFAFPRKEGWNYARSRLLKGLSDAGWQSGDHLVGSHVFRIDQRTAAGQGAESDLQRNRTVWDMEMGHGQRENAMWRDFKAALSVKRVSISLQKKDSHHGGPAFEQPLHPEQRGLAWQRWGCNRPTVNVDTGEPVDEPASTQTEIQTQTRAHDHHHHPQDAVTHNGQPTQGQGQDQGVLHQGVPQLGTGVDIFQSGKYYREKSFATPLSVQVGDQKPRFPINAPPIEHVRRPRGPDGIESDSMPIVSTQIMTPTEQRTLQQALFQMRSIALNRAQQCPHKGCTAFFPVGPDSMAAFHAHLDAKHIGTHCPFCDETLFKYWSAADKQKHFVDNHSEYFTAKGDLLREAVLAESTESKGTVHRREEQYNFCPRCGRNHQLLSSKADRVHHDNACFPGNEATVPSAQYCRRCGKPDSVRAAGGTTRQRQQHQCAAAATDPAAAPTPASAVFCQHCALECHQLPVSYGRRHLLNCKTLASKPDNWCPWCGVDLKSGPRAVRLKHLATCAVKPASGQNPVCTDSGIPFDSPRDHRARMLRHGLSNLGAGNGMNRLTVPPKCPAGDCGADLTSWNAQGLYYHFQSHLENALTEVGGLKSCPFCQCNFETRGFNLDWEKMQHFDDHIKGRIHRVLSDETIGSNPDRDSKAVVAALATRDNDDFDHKAEIEGLGTEIQRLSESVKFLTKENRDLKDAQRGIAAKKHKHKPVTPPSSGVASRRGARASRLSSGGGTDAPVSKRKDGAGQDLAAPPAKKSRVVHHGPSTTTVPGFSTGRPDLRGVTNSSEDWAEEEDQEEEDAQDEEVEEDEEDEELALESDPDFEEGIIDDNDFDDDLEDVDDDYDELAD